MGLLSVPRTSGIPCGIFCNFEAIKFWLALNPSNVELFPAWCKGSYKTSKEVLQFEKKVPRRMRGVLQGWIYYSLEFKIKPKNSLGTLFHFWHKWAALVSTFELLRSGFSRFMFCSTKSVQIQSFFRVRVFWYLNWVRRLTQYISVFSKDTGITDQRKLRILDVSHTKFMSIFITSQV